MSRWTDRVTKEDWFNQINALDNDSITDEEDNQINEFVNMTKNIEKHDSKTAALNNGIAVKAETRYQRSGDKSLSKKIHTWPFTTKECDDASENATQAKIALEAKRKSRRKDQPALKSAISAPLNMEKPTSKAQRKKNEPLSRSVSESRVMPPKKKAKKGLLLVPESEQVFKNLTFYFIPDDDIAQARRMRIEKIQQYGGIWVRKFVSGKTDYLVLERTLTVKDLLKFKKWDKVPAGLKVIDERFIGSCIRSGILLDAEAYSFTLTKSEEMESEMEQPKPESRQPRRMKRKISQEEKCISPVRGDDDDNVKLVTSEMPPESNSDLFTSIISEVKETAHLPLEEDSDQDETDLAIDKDIRPKSSSGIKRLFNQDSFACMQGCSNTTTTSSNPNARTIEILSEMAKYYDRINDNWRTFAYRKAVLALKKTSQKISTKDEALKVTGIGDSIATKIEEIVTTNNLQRLQSTMEDPVDLALQLFTGIYGVGFNRAQAWVNAGYRTLKDLEQTELTENQKIGLDHYEDFNSRISRSEVKKHGAIVKEVLKNIDPSYEATIMGSYRRGAKTSGDIDILITKPNGSLSDIRSLVLNILVPRLFNQGFLKCALASTKSDTGSKWHGASSLPDSSTWRRIDFLLVPWDERGAALIYFTGNDIFNRSMRLLAGKKGMRLNQKGLFKDVMRGKNRSKITEGERIEGGNEKKIFEILNVPWREPEDRDC